MTPNASSNTVQVEPNARFNPLLPSPPLHTSAPRLYRPDLAPLPSPLRPHCFAGERLARWRPQGCPELPWPLTTDNQTMLESVLAEGWADSTKETYGAGLLLFHVFCDSRGLSEEQRAPVSREVLEVFLASIMGSYSAAAVKNYYCGIKAWHQMHRIPWGVDVDDLAPLFRAAKSIAAKSSVLRQKPRVQREPYTVDKLAAICCQLDPSNSFEAAVLAVVTAAFWGIARIGELTVRRLDGFDPARHISISHVSTTSDWQLQAEVTVLHPPWTKSAGFRGEKIIWAQQSGPADPDHGL